MKQILTVFFATNTNIITFEFKIFFTKTSTINNKTFYYHNSLLLIKNTTTSAFATSVHIKNPQIYDKWLLKTNEHLRTR